MIRLYTIPQYEASTKAEEWLQNQGLPFKQINLLDPREDLKEQLFEILPLLEEGVFEMISKRDLCYKAIKFKINELSLSQLIDYLISKPRLIRQPILYDGKRVQFGFNSDEIRMFIPPQRRRAKFKLITERMTLRENVKALEQKKLGATG